MSTVSLIPGDKPDVSSFFPASYHDKLAEGENRVVYDAFMKWQQLIAAALPEFNASLPVLKDKRYKGMYTKYFEGKWPMDLIVQLYVLSDPYSLHLQVSYAHPEIQRNLNVLTYQPPPPFKKIFVNKIGKPEIPEKLVAADGEVLEGELTGAGRYLFANGDWIEGEIKDGKAHSGTYYYNNGDSYSGDYADGVPHGSGKLTKPDGTQHWGYYSKGSITSIQYIKYSLEPTPAMSARLKAMRDETNKPTIANKLIMENGEAVDSDAPYTGKARYLEKDGTWFEGNLLSNKQHGWGKQIQADGTVYEGEYRDGKIEGKGLFLYNDGSWYEGDVVNGKSHGKGIFHDSKKEFIYIGDFENDKMTGYGKVTMKSGHKLVGRFIKGSPVPGEVKRIDPE